MIIVIEGIDGAGKTSAIEHLQQKLRRECTNGLVEFIAEPGWSTTGYAAQNMIAGAKSKKAVFFAFMAARAENMLNVEKNPNCVYIFDRWSPSTFAYQTYIPSKTMYDADEFARGGAIADLIILLDADPANCIERIKARGSTDKQFERLSVMNEARHRYHAMAQRNFLAREWVIVDALRNRNVVNSEVLGLIAQRGGFE